MSLTFNRSHASDMPVPSAPACTREPAGETDPVLDLRDLWLRDANGTALVCGMSLRVEPGELVALVGESGSGKTLSARACLGLVPPGVAVQAGRARLVGTDVRTAGPHALRRLLGTHVGYVPQNTVAYLQPALRVRSQIADGYRTWHPGTSKVAARERAEALLRAVGIEDPRRVMASYPSNLSGGQRQRVNIAMALMGDPQLIVADEPTAALDSVTRAQVMDLLVRVARERGTALLMVSHDLSLVRSRCDRVCVMYAGRCVEEGPTAAVLGAPGHPYTQALLAAVPRPGMERGERLADVAGSMPETGRDACACTFAPRCLHACEQCRTDVPAWRDAPEQDGRAPHGCACIRAWKTAGGCA